MRQYRFPEFVKVTDEMHERGMRFVSAAKDSGCASVNVLYKEYLEEAIIPWLDEQEEIFLKSEINDDNIIGWHMFDFEGNWDFTEDEEMAMKYKAQCEASGHKDCVRALYYKR